MAELYIIKAIRSIRNFMYYVQAKYNKKKERTLHRISVNKGYSLFPYILCLSHRNQYKEYPMIYSLSYQEYFIELWLSPESEFIIKSKDSVILDQNYPIKLNSSQRLVNYIQSPIRKCINLLEHYRVKAKKLEIALEFKSSCKTIGKDELRNEDAYFFTPNVLGIADGIGSLYTKYGISSKDFSTELMQKCEELVNSGSHSLQGRKLIQEALKSVTSGGSSTYLIASLIKNRLHISNLGDCGLLLFRNHDSKLRLVFQTSAKYYNAQTPFQISKEFTQTQLNFLKPGCDLYNNLPISDRIDSDEYSITVNEGDIIVMGTDGLFDNLYTEEIQKIIKAHLKSGANTIASQLTFRAFKRSYSNNRCPFQDRMSNYSSPWRGGKKDDITVIVSIIQSE